MKPAIFAANEYKADIDTNYTSIFNREFIPTVATVPTVHSATITTLHNGQLLAAWFGGSREGANDVAIYGATRNITETGSWSQPVILVNRTTCSRELQRPLRKLGNPLLVTNAAGHIWLFFVIVSLGGWSTSSVAYKISTDHGNTFTSAKLLITSPILNMSTLVRTRALAYADHSMGIPMYHEMLGKYGLFMRINANGQILSLNKITLGRYAIQPTVVATGPTQAVALLRRTKGMPARVITGYSHDGGNSWSVAGKSNLPNPDASIAAVRRPNNEILMVYNATTEGRNRLSLASSQDGLNWQWLHDLELDQIYAEFSYPFLITSAPGEYHLLYTWHRSRIAYIHFNESWLQSLQSL